MIPCGVRGWLFCALTFAVGWAALPAAEPEKAPTEKISALIEKLGHEEFGEREAAGEALIKVGLPALKQLEAAIEHPDREIRYRSARVLARLREADLARRLDDFIQGKEGTADLPLPAWAAFKKAFGDTAESRQFFVEMQKAEPEVLQTVESDRKNLSDALQVKTQQIQHLMQFQQTPMSLGQVNALIFAATEAEGLAQQPMSFIYNFCHQQAFRDAITNAGPKKDLCRKLLGRWVRQGEDWAAYQGMMLAMQYELSDGLAPAIRILESGNRQQHLVQYASIAVAKFGDATHRPLLEKLLDDKTVCSQMQVNNKRIETQLRDVALACLIHMDKQDPKTYGFDRLQAAAPYLFNVNTLGFEADDKRAEAVKKYKEFQTKQKDAPPGEKKPDAGEKKPDAPPADKPAEKPAEPKLEAGGAAGVKEAIKAAVRLRDPLPAAPGAPPIIIVPEVKKADPPATPPNPPAAKE